MSDDELEQIVSNLTEKAIEITEKREAKRCDEQAAAALTLAELSASIVQRMGRALVDASRRVSETMAGESSFANEGDRRVAIALVEPMNHLLPLLEKMPDPEEQYRRFIPHCPICGAEPGQHWAHECPLIHENARDKFVWDYRQNCFWKLKDLDTEEKEYYGGKTPPCGICGAGPGTHWPAQCPENPIRHKMIADQVVPIERQLWYINEQRKKMGLSTVPID